MDSDLEFGFQKLIWQNQIALKNEKYSVDEILENLAPQMTSERTAKLKGVVEARSRRVVSVLENIYDRGNVSAVMRSAEAFGFLEVHLIDQPGQRFKAANRVTRGAEKWLDIHSHKEPLSVVNELKNRGYQVLATDLNASKDISDVNWHLPTAFVLGNEKEGVSQDLLGQVDSSFRIQMAGFSQSFNLSVAAALIFYHAHLERQKNPESFLMSADERRQCLANYFLRCFDFPERHLRR